MSAKKSVFAALLLTLSGGVFAEVAVVVHPSAGFDSLSEDDISRLFLGKAKSFPNGESAVPINQNEGEATRDKFNDAVVKKNASQLKAYWSQLVFTGKGTPPKDVGGSADVKKLVAANPNMIGYIDSSAVDGSVKVVYKIP
ncbi:MAG: phosphate ABC transporter substrate-binding protein [Permianibacter sp.]